jgi:hypothetical protein
VQGYSHRARGFAEDAGHSRRVQASQHPERDRFGLLGRKRGQQSDRPAYRQRVEHLILDQVIIGYGSYGFRHRDGRPALARPGVIDCPVPSDGEQPAPEILITAAKLGQVAHYLQPGLAGDVISIGTIQDAQVAQQARLELLPQLQKSCFVTRLGAG